jgi:hypothetical protein
MRVKLQLDLMLLKKLSSNNLKRNKLKIKKLKLKINNLRSKMKKRLNKVRVMKMLNTPTLKNWIDIYR